MAGFCALAVSAILHSVLIVPDDRKSGYKTALCKDSLGWFLWQDFLFSALATALCDCELANNLQCAVFGLVTKIVT